MGYEVDIIICTVSSPDEAGLSYASKIGSFDLCKVNLALSNIHEDKACKVLIDSGVIKKPIPVYYYGDDGATRIKVDLYGNPLYALDAKLLLSELKEKAAKEGYRRYPPLIAILESMIEVWGEEFYVILFGH